MKDDLSQYGPKRDANKRQEKESLKNLATAFSTDLFVLRYEQDEDAGVDLTIELVGDTYTNRRFNVQVKSKKKVAFNKDNRISKTVERKTLVYLVTSLYLGIYLLYNKKKKSYYYEWAHELEREAKRQYGEWYKRKKLTLHFAKPLNEQAVQEITKKVTKHAFYLRYLQTGQRLENLAASFHSTDDERIYTNIEESLSRLMDAFDGLPVLPQHLLIKLPPFARSLNSKNYFNSYGSTLQTDNLSLFDYFDSLTFDGQMFRYKNSDQDVDQDKVQEILNFFEYNGIHHLRYENQKRDHERICIHKLYKHDGCDCEKCSYPRMEWNNVIIKINSDFNKSKTYEWLRRGYMLLELRKIREAYDLYTALAEHSWENHKHVAYIIAKLNLVSMLRFVRTRFFHSERKEMEDAILKIDIQQEIHNLILRSDLPKEVLLVLLTLSKTDHFHELYVEADIRFEKILHAQFADQRGADVTHPHYETLIEVVSEIATYSEGNAFHWQYFNGFITTMVKAVEGALILSNIRNPRATKVEHFDNYLVRLCLRYADAETLRKQFIRHYQKPIPFRARHEDGPNVFLDYWNNMKTSFAGAENFYLQEQAISNLAPKERILNQIKVLSILLSVMEAEPEIIDQCANDLITLYRESQSKPGALLTGLEIIINRRQKDIQITTMITLYRYILESTESDNILLLLELPYHIHEKDSGFTDTADTTQQRILSRLEAFASGRDRYRVIVSYWPIAIESLKEKIAIAIREKLTAGFDGSLYYEAVLFGIIDYAEFLPTYLATIPMSDETKAAREAVGHGYDFKNDSLIQFIHLAYRLKIPLSDPAIQALHDNVPFHQWLLDLEGFDYSKFDPYWILLEPNADFLAEYKKHPKILEAVRQELAVKNIPRLSEIYFKHLIPLS